jgi:hypothetical protein
VTAHVQVVARARARGPLDRHDVRRPRALEELRGRAGPVAVRVHGRRLAQRAKGRRHHRDGLGIGHVADLGSERPQGATEHGGTGRAVGLYHLGLDDEAGGDDHTAAADQRLRRAPCPTNLEEGRDASASGIEREEMIDRVES